MNIILFGPPGAGKGTQADNIVKNFNLHKVSTGDLLREEINKKTILGEKIKSKIDKGFLVSDDLIENLIDQVLSNKKFYNKLVFDGYPRNINQASNLDILLKKYNQKISCVFSLEVDKDIVVKRILGRQTCGKCGLIFNQYFKPSTKENHSCGNKFLEKRSDDNEKIVLNRFQTYLDITLPIINYYKKLNIVHEIKGMAEIYDIYKEISTIIASLETWL